MSTTFGIHKRGENVAPDENGCFGEEFIENEFIKVAFTTNRGKTIWVCEMAQFIKDEIRVYALDNEQPKDIKTIGDIRKAILK